MNKIKTTWCEHSYFNQFLPALIQMNLIFIIINKNIERRFVLVNFFLIKCILSLFACISYIVNCTTTVSTITWIYLFQYLLFFFLRSKAAGKEYFTTAVLPAFAGLPWSRNRRSGGGGSLILWWVRTLDPGI